MRALRLTSVLIAIGIAMQPLAIAEQPERLARPVESHEGADGKLVVSPDATFGNLVVDAFASFGEITSTAGEAREALIKAYRPTLCNAGGIGSIAGHAAGTGIDAASPEERLKLKARDPGALYSLSTAILADLDGVSAEAIRADEAIGPGAYHSAIAGMSLALDRCDFFGLAGRL